MQTNERELATILHGLRMIQAEGRIEGCAAGACDHFADVAQLTNEEIDALCERINVNEYDTHMLTPPELSQDEWLRIVTAVTTKRTSPSVGDDQEWQGHLTNIAITIENGEYGNLDERDWTEVYCAMDSDHDSELMAKIGPDGNNMVGVR